MNIIALCDSMLTKVPPKLRITTVRVQIIPSQKAKFFIDIAVKARNLTKFSMS